MSYARPTSLTDALPYLRAGHRILAGGTDLYPLAGASLGGDVLDVTAIADLRGITASDQGLRIGACTTWSAIAAADLPPALSMLQQAARQVGARQVQNAGTIGGNICNASPAADGVPPLLALDAVVELAGPDGSRRIALADFITAPRRTQRQETEMVVALHLPQQALAGQSRFEKLGARAHLVISICMVAVRAVVMDGVVTDIAVAVGACSPVARRLRGLEQALIGRPIDQAADLVTPAAMADLAPIDDIRATADYRLSAAATLVRRAIAGVQA